MAEISLPWLASSSLGRSQQAVKHLLATVIPERAQEGPLIVVLDEVETLAADRRKMSIEANLVDVHRATDAVLAQIDQLADTYPNLLFIATSNFTGAIDDAFLSRADLIVTVDLPGPEACEKILASTVAALAEVHARLAKLRDDPKVKDVAGRCVGLDGRRVRKTVVSATPVTTSTFPERFDGRDGS
jgi:pachytene checkpoint protein 2